MCIRDRLTDVAVKRLAEKRQGLQSVDCARGDKLTGKAVKHPAEKRQSLHSVSFAGCS